MRNEKKDSSESFSIKTTKTMREKAQLAGRCVINMLKFWRICFRKKNTNNV
jgi:hypothetical protein